MSIQKTLDGEEKSDIDLLDRFGTLDELRDHVLDQFPEPDRGTAEYTGNRSRHTDVEWIRRYHGVPRYGGADVFDYENLVPDVFEHTIEAGPKTTAGGTDLLGVGKPGSGKSTFLNHLSKTILEVNADHREPVTWRGATSRSEWLPLAPITTLCLPRGADEISIELIPRDPTAPAIELDVDDLDRIVRTVAYYDDPRDLNQEVIEPGQFHVIYPDPSMRGCQRVYEESSKTIEPPNDRGVFEPEDPVDHWWFAYLLDRVEFGPFGFQTHIFDEIGDFAPEAARSDRFGTYEKIELLRDVWVDARKNHLTIFAFGHSERDIHNLIRHKIRWRVTMPGTANPTSKSEVVGFDAVPMDQEMTSRYSIGECLVYNETNFEQKVGWPDYEKPVNFKLKIAPEGGS